MSNKTFKVGDKQRHITIPEGQFRVTSGNAQEGDCFCNLQTLRFERCDKDDIGMPYDTFDLLIRCCEHCKGTGYEHLPFAPEGQRHPPCHFCEELSERARVEWERIKQKA